MSANNQIIINQRNYKVYENGCVDNLFVVREARLIGKGKSIKGAIKIAQKYMTENIVEYGIDFI